MRALANTVVMLLLVTGVASGGVNSGCGIFLDFDAGAEDWWDATSATTAVYPGLLDQVDVYVGLASEELRWDDEHGWEAAADLSVRMASFALVLPTFIIVEETESLLPGGGLFGDPSSGMIVFTYGPCVEQPVVYVARVRLRYLDCPGAITIAEHPDLGRRVSDCALPAPEVDTWCIIGHAAVGQQAQSGEPDCLPNTPVERWSWGRLKALYR